MPTLVIQLPNMPPVEHVLKDEALTIGRMKGNTIALDDASVSLSHAKLTRIGSDYFLKDLNSTNGTFLNGQSVTEARLHDGDHVKFGEVTGRYYAALAPSTAQTVAPVASSVTASADNSPPPTTPIHQSVATTPMSMRPVLMTKPKKPFPLIPVLAGLSGLALAGFLVWKFFLNSSNDLPPEAQAHQATTAVTAKPALADNSSVVTPKIILSPAATPQNIGATSLSNQDLPALLKSLKAADPVERRHAAAGLNSLGLETKDAVPALRVALTDTDTEVRMWAALSLISNRIYDKACIPILIQTLHHENPRLRQMACLSLGLIPYDGAEKEPVIAALTECVSKDDSSEVQSAAISVLKMIAHESTTSGK